MEQTETIFEHKLLLVHESTEQLDTTSKWTRFIGVFYAVMGVMMLILFIFMISNMDELAQVVMNQVGMEPRVMDFISQWGKILFGLVMFVISLIIFLNAYLLIRFRNAFTLFKNSGDEIALSNAFDNMGKYFLLATILSILSTISSIGIIIFSIMK